MSSVFAPRRSVAEVEEGRALAPRFDAQGLIPAVVTAHCDGQLLMLGYMNAEALRRTLETRQAHYWSRSRQCIWRKGETSGLIHHLVTMRVDDDQDALALEVTVAGSGASCHVGYRSCFYRAVEMEPAAGLPYALRFIEANKIFDPEETYAGQPNPTRL